MSSRTKYFIFMFVLAVGCYFMYELAERLFADPLITSNGIAQVTHQKGTGRPKIGGPFELIDDQGQAKSDADYKGKLMLIYFGYSYCPDICPTALYNITRALEQLGDKAKNITPLFITVDPGRDTVKQLALYKQNFHPNFIMLTGSEEQVKKAAKAYRVYYAKAKPDGTSTDYLIDHSSIVYLMDRQGRYLANFNHETPPDVMVAKITPYL